LSGPGTLAAAGANHRGLLLVAIVALALAGTGLLREQAEEQALSQVRLAGVEARDEIRRSSEDALTSARLLASRPTLQRLLRAGQPEPLEFFVRRFCETAGLDVCAWSRTIPCWRGARALSLDELAEPVREQASDSSSRCRPCRTGRSAPPPSAGLPECASS